MARILPMSEPIIKCYPGYAHVCSIVGAQSEYHIPWIYNYFVQLYVSDDFRKEFRIDYRTPYLYDNLPCIRRNHIARNIALEQWDGIINFIRYYIDRDYYVYGVFDVSKIAVYSRDHFFSHAPILYGYDDEKEEIYFGDIYGYGKYSLGIASYKEVINATKEITHHKDVDSIDWRSGFYCVRYTENCYPFQFDIDMFINLLTDYVKQKDSVARWTLPGIIRSDKGKTVCGIRIYPFMQEYLLFAHNEGVGLDRRGFYVLKEHKLILEKSLTYVMGEGWKKEYSVEWKMLEKDIQITTIMCNLCIKYNLTSEKNILDKLRDYLVVLEENDKILFPGLIRIVEEKHKRK